MIRYKSVLIGLGKISSINSQDKYINKSITYSTHAQVLTEHPSFNLVAGVDISKEARDFFKKQWKVVEVVDSVDSVSCKNDIEVAVLATPPNIRREILSYFPKLKAIIVEKPLGTSYELSKCFVEQCNNSDILLQVNLTRRSDDIMKNLADGLLNEKIGNIQTIFGIYGNGLRNNGVHMIDLIRMLIGDIQSVKALYPNVSFLEGPIENDRNFAFQLLLNNNVQATFHPLNFKNYRENSIDIFGEYGKIQIVNEGLSIIHTPSGQCRSYAIAKELVYEKYNFISTGYGNSLYNLYQNLIDTLENKCSLDSSGDNALRSTKVIEEIFNSYDNEGETININYDC